MTAPNPSSGSSTLTADPSDASTSTSSIGPDVPSAAGPAPLPSAPLHSDYTLIPTPPDLASYLALRRTPGLSAKSEAQGRAGLHGAWRAAHIVHSASGAVVAMGRVLGDGGWYFHIVDLAVHSNHQRRGIGAAVLAHLLQQIRDEAPPGAFVNLFADPPGRKLYERFGFMETAPNSVGLGRTL